MRDISIVQTSSVNSDGSHELQHPAKTSIDVYRCIRSIKRRIEKDLTASISL